MTLAAPRRYPVLAPLLLSALLHVGLLWKFGQSTPGAAVPVGVWVEMAPGPAGVSKPAPRRVAVTPDEQLATEQAPAPADTLAANRTGNAAASSGLSGQLGDLNGAQVSAKERYLYELEVHLNQFKSYPARARHLGLEGEVGVAVHIYQDGSVKDPHVVRPCVHDVLNRAALALLESTPTFRPLPKELGLDVLHVTVPIHYQLH